MKSRLVIEFSGSETDYDKLKEYVKNKSDVVRILKEDFLDNTMRYNDLEIDRKKRQVTLENKQIDLTALEFDILCFLASQPGQVFSHRQIYESVWQNEYFQDEANITAHIGHIRKKIEPNSKSPIYIQTVHGVGYKFAEKY